MKASLQLKLGQHLTMTPQLQQAIRLLQLSSLELQQEIQEALENNPLLEIEEEFHSAEETSTDPESQSSTTDIDHPQRDTVEEFSNQEINEELPIDANWDDVFTSTPNTSSASMAADDEQIYQGETIDNLYQHLEWQKNLTPFSETDLAIATAIIEAIDEQGYLTQSTDDILEAMGDDEVELDEVEAVLKRIQHFDPIGVGARDLRESLLIQLQQYPNETPFLEQAKVLIDQHLSLIAVRDFRVLMRKTKLKEEELRQAIHLIQSLNPRPGLLVSPESNDYVIPDISVYKHNGRWQVELNPNNTPKLNVNQFYASMRNSHNQTDNQFIRDHLQEAKWFIKSLESRNDTLLKVAKCIVQFQQGFFEFGPESMRPMVLNDVAQAVNMHESTISRVTTQKFMHTPRGIFELKYFFSSHVSTDDGGECSSTAIRALIKKLIAAENPKKPLSDNKIAELLAEQRINVARRTIAKYREAMLIPPSNQRKSL